MGKAGDIYRHFASKFSAPQKGDLRVWWIPQVPGKSFEWPVADVAQAALLLDVLTAYDDFQFGENVKGDYCNTGGLMIHNGEDFEDWEDEDCDGFYAWHQKQKEIELEKGEA